MLHTNRRHERALILTPSPPPKPHMFFHEQIELHMSGSLIKKGVQKSAEWVQ